MKICDEFQLKISRLTDGELSDDQAADVFFHLASCRECRSFFGALQSMNTALAAESLEEPLVDAGVPWVLRERDAMPRGRMTSHRWLQRRLAIPLPALGSMILLLGVLLAAIVLGVPGARHTETVYVTKLPAVIVTSEQETIHTLN